MSKITLTRRDLLPADVRSGRMKLARFQIWPVGVSSDSFGRFSVDGQVRVVQPHPEVTLYLCPLRGRPHPDPDTVTFWSDCLAFEHDCAFVPVLRDVDYRRLAPRPLEIGPTRPWPVAVYSTSDEGPGTTSYVTQHPLSPRAFFASEFPGAMAEIANSVREMRHGAKTWLISQYIEFSGDLAYSKRYKGLEDAVHFYAAALRQPDLVAEYLFYFRALEAVVGRSAQGWIGPKLAKLSKYLGPDVLIAHEDAIENQPPRRLMALLRRRATTRAEALLRQLGSTAKVAAHLGDINRNAAAHGTAGMRSDFSNAYFNLSEDTLLLKVLARIGIESRAQHTAGAA